jgi:hypothetical protein
METARLLYTQGDYTFPPQSNILGCGIPNSDHGRENNYIRLTISGRDMLPGSGVSTGTHRFSCDMSQIRIVPAYGRKSLTPQKILFLAEAR